MNGYGYEFVWVHALCVQVPAGSKRVVDSLDLELQVVLSHLAWALETELGRSTGAEVLLAAEQSLLSWTSTLTPELPSASHPHRLGKMKTKYKVKAGINSITTWFFLWEGVFLQLLMLWYKECRAHVCVGSIPQSQGICFTDPSTIASTSGAESEHILRIPRGCMGYNLSGLRNKTKTFVCTCMCGHVQVCRGQRSTSG